MNIKQFNSKTDTILRYVLEFTGLIVMIVVIYVSTSMNTNFVESNFFFKGFIIGLVLSVSGIILGRIDKIEKKLNRMLP